jgi:uncharacterized protein YeaO (DUF488 family)
MIATKRAYEPASDSDGYRVLIDRLWPRGVSKARRDSMLGEGHCPVPRRCANGTDTTPDKWHEFQVRYAAELRTASAKRVLDSLVRRARRGRVTLVYASRAGDLSDAAVLKRILNRRLVKTRQSASHPRLRRRAAASK